MRINQTRVSSSSQFSKVITKEMRTPGWIKDEGPAQRRRLFQKTHLSHDGPRRSRSSGISASQRQEERTLKLFQTRKKRSTAVGLWARPPVLSPALSQASHSPFCGHPSVLSDGLKNLLTNCGVDLLRNELLLSSYSGAPPTRTTPSHLKRGSPSRRDRPSRCPPRHHSPSLLRVSHGRTCDPLRRLSGSRRDQGTCNPSASAEHHNLTALRCVTALTVEMTVSTTILS